jgi:hypothetical protein
VSRQQHTKTRLGDVADLAEGDPGSQDRVEVRVSTLGRIELVLSILVERRGAIGDDRGVVGLNVGGLGSVWIQLPKVADIQSIRQ